MALDDEALELIGGDAIPHAGTCQATGLANVARESTPLLDGSDSNEGSSSRTRLAGV